MKRESLYCQCGHPIEVIKDRRVLFKDGTGEIWYCIFQCPSCGKKLEYKNLVERGNLELKEKTECL